MRTWKATTWAAVALAAALAWAPSVSARPAGSTLAQAKDAKAAEEARVLKALQQLEQANASGSSSARVQAIRSAAEIADERLVTQVAKALRDADRLVVEAAIEGLRFCEHPAALKALHGALKGGVKLKDDAELAVKVIRAIGQHAHASSVRVLTEDVFETKGYGAKARILCLGRIQSRESVAGLMSLMRVVGAQEAREFMEEFRIALIVLTGVDKGESQAAWTAWWNDNKRTFELPGEPGLLPKPLLMRWNAFWGLEEVRERSTARDRRGERDGG